MILSTVVTILAFFVLGIWADSETCETCEDGNVLPVGSKARSLLQHRQDWFTDDIPHVEIPDEIHDVIPHVEIPDEIHDVIPHIEIPHWEKPDFAIPTINPKVRLPSNPPTWTSVNELPKCSPPTEYLHQVRSKREFIGPELWSLITKGITDALKEAGVPASTAAEVDSCFAAYRVDLNTCKMSQKDADDKFLTCAKGQFTLHPFLQGKAEELVDAVFEVYKDMFTAYKQYFVLKLNCQCKDSSLLQLRQDWLTDGEIPHIEIPDELNDVIPHIEIPHFEIPDFAIPTINPKVRLPKNPPTWTSVSELPKCSPPAIWLHQVRSKKEPIAGALWDQITEGLTDALEEAGVPESTASEVESCISAYRVDLNTCKMSQKDADDKFTKCCKEQFNLHPFLQGKAEELVDSVFEVYKVFFTAYKQQFVIRMNCQCEITSYNKWNSVDQPEPWNNPNFR